MNNNTCTAVGKVFFALAILCIGIIHFVQHNFPVALVPAPEIPHKIIFVYISGGCLIISALLILSNKFTTIGGWVAFVIWLIDLLALQLPLLLAAPKNGGAWAATFETAMLVAGSLLLMGASHTVTKKPVLTFVGRYLFASAMLVFAVQHYIYAQYIASLITAWIPFKLFLTYLVGIGFLAVAISIIINKFVLYAGIALGTMFLLWFFILHLPLVLTHLHVEAQWTSLFFVLGASGEAFLIAGSAIKSSKRLKHK